LNKPDLDNGNGAGLPAYTEADYGKVLSITAEGLAWIKVEASVALADAEEVAF
jgi:hypothetical protein